MRKTHLLCVSIICAVWLPGCGLIKSDPVTNEYKKKFIDVCVTDKEKTSSDSNGNYALCSLEVGVIFENSIMPLSSKAAYWEEKLQRYIKLKK